MADKIQLTYETYQSQSHGYTHTHVVIREMYVEDTGARLAGTVDNKDGYGTLEYAQKAGHRYQSLLNAGHTCHYIHSTYGTQVHLQWQHYDVKDGKQTYCAVSYEDLGRTFKQIERGTALLRKVARRVETARYGEARRLSVDNNLDCPEDVLAVLDRMKKATRVRFDTTTKTMVKAA